MGDWTAFTERMLEELFDRCYQRDYPAMGRAVDGPGRLTGPLAPSTPFDGCGGAAGEQFVLGALRSRLPGGAGRLSAECLQE